MEVPYIQARDVEHQLNWLGLVEALEQGHRGVKARLKDQMIERGGDVLLSRSAWIGGQGMAVKAVSIMPDNKSLSLPTVQGALVLFEDATGQVEAVVDSALVTKWKTAGDSLLGAKFLAREDSQKLLIVGAGAVAASLIEAYRALFPDIDVSIWNRSPQRAVDLAKSMKCRAVPQLEQAVKEADIVSVATISKTPLIQGKWLKPGQHLDLIGAFRADMREADDDALRRSRVFVDCKRTTLAHIGELKIPLENGVITRDDVRGDLYDLAKGSYGRKKPEDITFFKNGGGAHLDLMTARIILDVYRQQR